MSENLKIMAAMIASGMGGSHGSDPANIAKESIAIAREIDSQVDAAAPPVTSMSERLADLRKGAAGATADPTQGEPNLQTSGGQVPGPGGSRLAEPDGGLESPKPTDAPKPPKSQP